MGLFFAAGRIILVEELPELTGAKAGFELILLRPAFIISNIVAEPWELKPIGAREHTFPFGLIHTWVPPIGKVAVLSLRAHERLVLERKIRVGLAFLDALGDGSETLQAVIQHTVENWRAHAEILSTHFFNI